ncbi:sensor histidine kinase [Streptomyces sp. 4N509B]|uniref:sensor histidine kinase n=1 Tax=Streptomyces sp. 4N509B TaxID=3457413 RepID=UPI003FD2EAD4
MSGIRDRHRVPRALRTSLRVSLALPVLIAVLALAGLAAYLGNGLVRDGLQLRAGADLAEGAGEPAHQLVTRLQDERLATAAWQAAPGPETLAALQEARGRSDTAAEAFRAADSENADRAAVREHATRLLEALEALEAERLAVDEQESSTVEAYRFYTNATDHGVALLGAALRVEDGQLAQDAAAAAGLVQLAEAVARQHALVAGVPDGEGANGAVREAFAQAVAVQRQARTALHAGDVPPPQGSGYESLTETPEWSLLVAAETPDSGGTTAMPEPAEAWREAAESSGAILRDLGVDTVGGVGSDASGRGGQLLVAAALVGLLAAAVLVGAALLAWRMSRSLVGRLTRLQQTASRQTESDLARIVEQTAPEPQGPREDERSEEDFGSDEVARLAEALRQQWHLVVDTIQRQARGREGSERVFLGLARRTQVLINRMIPMLDKLEREHQDSKLLKDIFAVDHLATRVRRHTENLLILGGALPARRWSKPVPVYELMRSAISETEDYSRVEALPAPQISLAGRAVADVVHLLAELIENGTSFSPPETKVTVSAEIVARGRVALEIVDRGLGMSDEEYDRLNRLLSDAPKLDVMALGEAPRLGLFVVARLAKRHGLEISLRKSPYGGTLAVVLLPSELLEESKSLLAGLIPDGLAAAAGDGEPGVSSSSSERAERAERAEAETPWRESVRPPAAPPMVPPLSPGLLEPDAPEPESPSLLPTPEPVAARPVVAQTDLDAPGRPQRRMDYDHSGYPAYGGAGLLPSLSDEEAAELAARTHPPVDRDLTREDRVSARATTPEAPPASSAAMPPPASAATRSPTASVRSSGGDGLIDAADDGSSQQPTHVTAAGSQLKLPVRVRGESLAEQLRVEASALMEEEEAHRSATASQSPDRAGAIMAAIQSGNRRARTTEPSTPAGGHDPEAGTPGHGADPEGSARKDQR